MRRPSTIAPTIIQPTLLSALTLVVVLAASSLIACGGNDNPTIKHRLDMSSLAQTPPEERLPVAAAYRSQYAAEQDRAHTAFALKDSQYALKIARAKQAQGKQDQKIAELESKRSEAAFMTSLANAATKLLDRSKKDAQTQKLEISYLEAQRKYLKKYLSYTEAQVVATEAAFELAKAKLAKERGATPKDFDLAKFANQEKSIKDWAAKRSQGFKSALAKAQEKKAAWKNASK